MAAPKGIARYNRIRSQLSKHIKKEGVELEPWAFNAMSRDIFRTTKSDPFPRVTENISTLAEGMRGKAMVPILMPEDTMVKAYYDVDRELPEEALPDDVWIVSPEIYGKDVKLSDYRYEMDAKPMVQWVDENRDPTGEDPTKLFGETDKVPLVKFIAGDFDEKIGGHPAIWNPKKMRWEIELAFVDGAGEPWDYGYEPGAVGYMPPEEIGAVMPVEEKMIPPEKVPVKEPLKEVPDRELQLLKAETKRLKQEARLEKAKASAARERTALIKELREIGYTKDEIKAELAKL